MTTNLLEGERALVTGFVAHNFGDLIDQIFPGRPGKPDDTAQMAVAVLSERFGRYVADTTLEVDGPGLVGCIRAEA